MEAQNRVWENRETETMEECGGGDPGGCNGETGVVLGGCGGFFVGGLDCLNARRRPCVSRLPILLGNQDPGSRQAPWEDPPFPSAEN